MSSSSDIPIDPVLMVDLLTTYQDVLESALALSHQVKAECHDYPLYIPTDDALNPDIHSSVNAAIDSMCRIHFESTTDTDESQPAKFHAGIVCASTQTIDCAKSLNSTKDRFKQAVKALNNYHKKHQGSVPVIATMIRDEITERGYRSSHLKKALKHLHASRVNLKRAYAHVRIMPPDTDSMSWTWQTGHSTIKSITVEQALKLAAALPHPSDEISIKKLNTCHIDEKLVIKKSLPNQLRANYTFMQGDERIRKSTPLSGVVLVEQDYLPRLMWRDKPESNSKRRIASSSARYQDEPFVLGLNLYRLIENG